MSKYTTELRHICETYAGLTDQFDSGDTQEIIEQARPKLFNFSYPIFDSEYKSVLETKIIRHFYFREIGFETVAAFKFKLQTLLNEIMPYYNKMYESTQFEYNPLYDTDYNTVHQGVGTENGTIILDGEQNVSNRNVRDAEGTSRLTTTNTTAETVTETHTDTANKWDKYSDTPQGSISRINLENDSYLTNARNISDNVTGNKNASDNTQFSETKSGTTTDDIVDTLTGKTETDNTTTSTARSTEDYTRRVYGKFSGRTYPQMIKEYRNALLNIDMLIINDLEPLFFALW